MFVLMGNTMPKVTPAAEQYLFVHAHTVYFLNFFFSFHLIPSKWNTHHHTCWNTYAPTRVDCAAGVHTVYDSRRWSFPHGCNLVYSLTPLFSLTYPLYNDTILNFTQLSYHSKGYNVTMVHFKCIPSHRRIQNGRRILSFFSVSSEGRVFCLFGFLKPGLV